MTTPTEYRQARNTLARKTGASLNCPECGHVLDHTEDLYHCGNCSYTWDQQGEPIAMEGTP